MLRVGLAVSVTLLLGALGCAEDHQPRSAAGPAVAASDAGRDAGVEVAAVSGCEYRGRHYIAGERFFDAEECQSCRCERAGNYRAGQVSCSTAFCDEGTRCDGGPCSSCSIEERTFGGVALREELRGGREHGSLLLEIGDQTLPFEF